MLAKEMIELDELCLKFINHVHYIWKGRITKTDIEKWFENFQENTEIDTREMASNLLNGFIYYTEDEVKYLCRYAYLQYKQEKVKDFVISGVSVHDAGHAFEEHLKKCVFSHIGKPGESGCFILYYFRQKNKISTRNFLQRWDELNCETESIIFVDDFIGSGDTAIHFWKSDIIQNIIKRLPYAKIYYLALIGLEKGIEKMHSECPEITIICSQVLDREYQVFSDTSYIFPEEKTRELSRKVCQQLGCHLEGEDYALGYKNSEVMVGFHHNIPNNTLPLIWSGNKGWYPIFVREKKIY